MHPEHGVLAARRDDIEVEALGDELVVYDRRTDEAHLLNPLAAEVWRALEEPSTLAALGAQLAHQSTEQIWWAVVELERKDLVSMPFGLSGFPVGGLSRRQLLRRMGVAAVAIPTISTIFSASAASAAPTCGGANENCNGVGGVSTCCSGRTCINSGNGNQGRCCSKATEPCTVVVGVPQGTCCSGAALCVPIGVGATTGNCSA